MEGCRLWLVSQVNRGMREGGRVVCWGLECILGGGRWGWRGETFEGFEDGKEERGGGGVDEEVGR